MIFQSHKNVSVPGGGLIGGLKAYTEINKGNTGLCDHPMARNVAPAPAAVLHSNWLTLYGVNTEALVGKTKNCTAQRGSKQRVNRHEKGLRELSGNLWSPPKGFSLCQTFHKGNAALK